MRWRMLIKQMGYDIRPINSFLAVMVNYIANLAVPRLGEVSRCGVIKQYEKVPFTQSFGTVIAERAIDLIMLFILFLVVFAAESPVILEFLQTNPEVSDKFKFIFESPMFIGIVAASGIGLILAFLVLRKRINHFKIYIKIKEFILNLLTGIKSVWQLEKKWLFILHTVFIWSMYFVMTYICFFAFDFTTGFSPLKGLTVFVLASFGMVAPVQGGIGAWHFMVTRTLLIFGVAIEPDGNAFALVVHGAQTLMLVLVGAMAIIALPLVNRKTKAA